MQFNDNERWLEIEAGSGIWSYNKPSKSSFPLRMIALALKDGSLLIYSPIKDIDDLAWKRLEELGEVKYLMAPNHFHSLGLESYKKRFPDAQIIASTRAIARLEKVTKVKVENLEVLGAKMPDHIELVEPEGMKTGEVWLVVQLKMGKAWILCDAFFNMPIVPQTLFGLILRLGGTAPGMRISRVFRLIGIKDKAQYMQWLKIRLNADNPVLMLPSHGDIAFDGNLLSQYKS